MTQKKYHSLRSLCYYFSQEIIGFQIKHLSQLNLGRDAANGFFDYAGQGCQIRLTRSIISRAKEQDPFRL